MDYSDPNVFNSMQEEAIKRVQEMQRRSRNLVGGSPPEPDINHEHAQPENHHGQEPDKDKKSPVLFNIGGIEIDEEKALIALMIYVLYKNGSDIKLLLGLGYLLI